MRALVTGGSGFIGRRLIYRLLEMGADVKSIDDLSTHSPGAYDRPQVITKYGRVQDCIMFHKWEPEVIFHLAGKVGPVGVVNHRGQIAKDTIDAAAKVADWAEEYGATLVFTSTSEVYGNNSKTNEETDLPVIQLASGRSEYAASKLAAEYMLHNRNIDLRIIRPFNIAGPGQRTDGGFVLPRFAVQALTGQDLTVYVPGTQERSFTHIDDFIDGMLLVLDRGGREVYNVGNPFNRTSILVLAHSIVRVAGTLNNVKLVDPKELHGPDFREAPDKIPDAHKLINLGWAPFRYNETIVSDVVQDYRRRMRVTDSGTWFTDS